MFNSFDPHFTRQHLTDGGRGPQYFRDQVEDLPETVWNKDDVRSWPWQQIDYPEQHTEVAGNGNCVHRKTFDKAFVITRL